LALDSAWSIPATRFIHDLAQVVDRKMVLLAKQRLMLLVQE